MRRSDYTVCGVSRQQDSLTRAGRIREAEAPFLQFPSMKSDRDACSSEEKAVDGSISIQTVYESAGRDRASEAILRTGRGHEVNRVSTLRSRRGVPHSSLRPCATFFPIVFKQF